jgi:hypothetical protein
MNLKLITLALFAVLLGGCMTVLTQRDVDVIDTGKGNAVEWDNRFQATTQPTPEQWATWQRYSSLNKDNWTHLSNIARRTKEPN